ncbi:MAG: hypothetical protein AAF805_05110 [Planctomycetota bacterium]
MNFDELRSAWAAKNAGESSAAADRERLVVRVCRRTEQFWGRVARRDVIETLACVFLIWFFGREAIDPDRVFFERLGAAVIVLGSAFIAWRLNAARLFKPPTDLDAPMREFCQRETERLDTQIRLLRGVWWWYLAPLWIGLALRSFGKHAWQPGFFAEVGFATALFLPLWWLNRSVANGKFTDLRNELTQLEAELAIDPIEPNDPSPDPEEP